MDSRKATEPDFDVALSFAGEDRGYVERVATRLRDAGVRVFYDEFMVVETWGADLYSYFDDIYRNRAKFAVIFVSADYARKAWTSHERQSAQARALMQQNVYLLPVRLDDTELPGLRPTVGYVDARKVSPEALTELIQRKLAPRGDAEVLPPRTYGIPWTEQEQHDLLSARPPAWEYLLFAGVLWRGKMVLEPKFRDYELGYARIRGEYFRSIPETLRYVERQMFEMSEVAGRVMTIFRKEAQEWAFGLQGVPGDPERIEHLAKRALTIYEDMLDGVARLRGALVPDECRQLIRLAVSSLDPPILQSRQFIDSTVLQIGTLPERIARGENAYVGLDYTISVDLNVERAISKEVKRLNRIVRRQA
jgi:hypothetical protein